MPQYLTCEVCGTRNRVSPHSKNRQPLCGRCKAPLKENWWKKAAQGAESFVSEVASEDWWRKAKQEAERLLKSDVSVTLSHAEDIFRSSLASIDPTGLLSSVSPELEQMLEELVGIAWTNPRNESAGFLLEPDRLGEPKHPHDIAQAVEVLYKHTQRWAPGLNVPYRPPDIRIAAELPNNQAGTFHRGYRPTITVLESMLFHTEVLRGILAHEACHHIRYLSSLEEPAQSTNERKTDLTMYICGFGKIALQCAKNPNNRFFTLHILQTGYLTLTEHQQIYAWTNRRRKEMPENTTEGDKPL